MNRRFFLTDIGSKAAAATLAGGAALSSQAAQIHDTAHAVSLEMFNGLKKTLSDQLTRLESRVSRVEAQQAFMLVWLVALSVFTGFDFTTLVLA